MEAKKIRIERTAHYYIQGDLNNKDTAVIWFVLHGYGQLAEFFIEKFKSFEERGDVVIAPASLSSYYVDGSSGRVGGSWMTKRNREDEILDYVNYLDSLYAFIRNSSRFKPGVKINVLGFSQGVSTAARWAVMGKSHLDRLILWSGSLPKDVNGKGMNEFETYFLYGLQDAYLSSINVNDQNTILQNEFTPFTVDTFEGKHELTAELLAHFAHRYHW